MNRSLVAGLVEAMVFALLPSGVAAAEVIDTDVAACGGAEGLVDFNDALGFFESDIECMAAFGITVGDADGNFNSAGSVTRQQMALFIARLVAYSLNGSPQIPEASSDLPFWDVAVDNPAHDAISFLLGTVVEGVGGGEYDPSGTVTRQQMASFVARALMRLEVDLDGFAATSGLFGDEDEISDVHLDNVLLLADVGVVEGDAEGGYNPDNPVTRGQMSAFIVRSIVVLDAQDLWPRPSVPEPHFVDVSATNGGTAGIVDTGDVLVFTLSEPAQPISNTSVTSSLYIEDQDGTSAFWSCQEDGDGGQPADCSLSSDGLEFMVEILQDVPSSLLARGSISGIQVPGLARQTGLKSVVDDLSFGGSELVSGF